MSYKDIEDRRAYMRAYMKDIRHWRKAHRLCAECGQRDAFTMNGRYRCSVCAERKAGHPIDYVQIEKPWKEPSWRKDGEKSGRCYICGAPVMDGESKWSGRPLRVCEKHYSHMCRLAEGGRAAFKAQHGETWGQWEYRKQYTLPPSASKKR